MKRLKGPELKLGELRPPAFLADLYHDLRDRRLLPLVALVLVAIAAVPFLLGGGEEAAPLPPELVEAVEFGGGSAVDGVSLAVVEATPGLRDYRKRLRGKRPTDPFVQRYTAPMVKGAKLNPESSTGSSSSSLTKTTTVEVDGGSGSADTTVTTTKTTKTTTQPDAPGGSGSAPGRVGERQVAIDIQVSRTETTADGSRRMGTPKLRRNVEQLTVLPGPKAPVVTTMGGDRRRQTVLLMVSHDVTAIEGDAKCISGSAERCQLVEVEAGFPLVLTHGRNEVRHRFMVVRVSSQSFSK